jgi:hypothetical protein
MCDNDDCPREAIWEVLEKPPMHLCNQCRDELFKNLTLLERIGRSDDSLTRPIGDPDEAMHRGSDDVA